jgi:plastocyanin
VRSPGLEEASKVLSEGRKSSLAVLVAIAAVVAAVACGSSSNATGPTAAPAGTHASGAANVTIVINSMSGPTSFSPDPATLQAGQTVAWRNADSMSHTATGSGFDTGGIPPGGTSAPIAMNTAGRIDYHCSFHPSMQGKLNVTDASGSGSGY